MSDTPEANGTDEPQISMRILAQYVRDLSFENAMAQKGVDGEVQPEMAIRVNLEPRKRGVEDQFEVIQKTNIKATNKTGGQTLFEAELEYAGIFEIKGIAEDQLLPFLMVECPRLLFPYIRRIISDVTRDGGFPPFNMDQIDYVALFRAEMERRAAEAGEGAPQQ